MGRAGLGCAGLPFGWARLDWPGWAGGWGVWGLGAGLGAGLGWGAGGLGSGGVGLDWLCWVGKGVGRGQEFCDWNQIF